MELPNLNLIDGIDIKNLPEKTVKILTVFDKLGEDCGLKEVRETENNETFE